jgi:uncharacterized protein involved in oxidation of intracellular sulfur
MAKRCGSSCWQTPSPAHSPARRPPDGYYNLERLLTATIRRGAQVGLCGTCMDARAIEESRIIEGTHRSTLEEFTDWTVWADKVIAF